ncbi:MAG: hypothetical protein J2P48_01660 [Alphaproteobacteria bacterium]|nr:hypothetical protein [Alphaproteobacteria bacterium]
MSPTAIASFGSGVEFRRCRCGGRIGRRFARDSRKFGAPVPAPSDEEPAKTHRDERQRDRIGSGVIADGTLPWLEGSVQRLRAVLDHATGSQLAIERLDRRAQPPPRLGDLHLDLMRWLTAVGGRAKIPTAPDRSRRRGDCGRLSCLIHLAFSTRRTPPPGVELPASPKNADRSVQFRVFRRREELSLT